MRLSVSVAVVFPHSVSDKDIEQNTFRGLYTPLINRSALRPGLFSECSLMTYSFWYRSNPYQPNPLTHLLFHFVVAQ